MNEVQMRILNLIGSDYTVENFYTDRDDTVKIYTDFGLCVWIEDDNSVFYEIESMPRSHNLMLVVSEIVHSIENILNESELV